MGHSVKVSLWCVALLINTRFAFYYYYHFLSYLFQNKQLLSVFDVISRQRASK